MYEETQESAAGLNYMEGTLVRDGMRDILDREWSHMAEIARRWKQNEIDHLYLVGCGGSYATMVPLKWLTDQYSTLPVDVYTGWEFINRLPARLGKRSAVIVASHSGTTEEVLIAAEVARKQGAFTLAFTTTGAELESHVDDALTYKSPAANLSKLLMSYLVAFEVIDQRDQNPAVQPLRAALQSLPDAMHGIIQDTRSLGQQLAEQYRSIDQMYVIGTGLLAGLAYQFTICNLLEMHWIHAATINAAEFRHGPYEIVDQGLPMIFLLGRGPERAVTQRALDFSQRFGADTIVFDLNDMPQIHDWCAPFGLHLPLQWFNWYLGIARNHPISTRRYMGKVDY